ncbi:MAG: Tol-Pal system protein TolB, partial [Rickettsiales bacterium]|nr:Tol-Pal system protein TolB [Rickettsiales bacterium]
MKKFLVLLIAGCWLLIAGAHAEIKVDITAGDLQPIPIAVQKPDVSGGARAADAAMLQSVISADLKSTGLFHIINPDAFPENVAFDSMPKFADWAAIKTQVLVQSKLTVSGDKYSLHFYVWDINGKEQIEAQILTASKKSLRRLAHITADAIYERLTGEVGYFDTQIVFIAESGPVDNRTKRLAVMDSDGFGLRYMSDGKTMVMSPHFSPNMQTIIFLSYYNDEPSVWTLDMNTGAQKRLGKFGGMTFAPRWSPDGTRVAMSLEEQGATNIFEYDTRANTMRRLTSGDGINTSPAYSPDGKQLAFNSNRSGSQQLHLLDLQSGDEKRLSFGAGRYATPAFSGDGRFIAFTKISDDTFYIGVMDRRGKNEHIL